MPPSGSAVIEIGSIFARVRPGDVVSLVASELSYMDTTFVEKGSGSFAKKQRLCHFYELEDDGAVRILVGHVGRVKAALERAGVLVSVQDRRQFRAKAAPSRQLIEAAQGDRRHFLELIAREPRGLIEVRNQIHVLWLTSWICRLFTAARIYVPVATRRQVTWTRRELERFLGAPVNVYEDYTWPWEGGRLVCTLRTFDAVNPDDVEVLIFPDATRAAVPGHFQAFASLPCQRVYGFIRSGQTLSAKGRLRLEGLFGPIEHRIPDPRGTEATVLVHWCMPPEFPSVRRLTALERKRRSCWRNGQRNDLIAVLAKAFRAGDQEQIWRHGLFLEEEQDVFLGTDRYVTILVESTEHGRELCRRLPGWKLWDVVPPQPNVEKGSVDAQSVLELGIPDRVVLTLAQASLMDTVYTDVLIVASGQGWPDAVPGFPNRSLRGDHQVLLLDLADDFDKDARQATLRRQRAYAGRGWHESKAPAWMRPVQ
jgi:hypothetical protein